MRDLVTDSLVQTCERCCIDDLRRFGHFNRVPQFIAERGELPAAGHACLQLDADIPSPSGADQKRQFDLLPSRCRFRAT